MPDYSFLGSAVGPGDSSIRYFENPLYKQSTEEDSPYFQEQQALKAAKIREAEAFRALEEADPIFGKQNSFSFANIQAQILLPFLAPKTNAKLSASLSKGYLAEQYWGTVVDLPGLTLLSLSEHRDVYPVVSLGHLGIKSFTTGNILHAGTLGFTVFGEGPFTNAIRAYAAWRGDLLLEDHVKFTSPSELPPFDISLAFLDEKGGALASKYIRSVKLVDSSKNISVNDISLTDTYSFMAASVSNLISHKKQLRGLKDPNTYQSTNPTSVASGEAIAAPIGSLVWAGGLVAPRSVTADDVNALGAYSSGFVNYSTSAWTLAQTTLTSGVWIASRDTVAASGLINNTPSSTTPYGTGAVLTWQVNDGTWVAGTVYTLNFAGRLKTTATWLSTSMAPTGVTINELLLKPNIVVKNPPPAVDISFSVYDSWRRSPFAVYKKIIVVV